MGMRNQWRRTRQKRKGPSARASRRKQARTIDASSNFVHPPIARSNGERFRHWRLTVIAGVPRSSSPRVHSFFLGRWMGCPDHACVVQPRVARIGWTASTCTSASAPHQYLFACGWPIAPYSPTCCRMPASGKAHLSLLPMPSCCSFFVGRTGGAAPSSCFGQANNTSYLWPPSFSQRPSISTSFLALAPGQPMRLSSPPLNTHTQPTPNPF